MRGQWKRNNKKGLVEAYPQLDMARLTTEIDLQNDVSYTHFLARCGQGSERLQSVYIDILPEEGLYLRHMYKGQEIEPYPIPIVTTQPNYGGKRYWFLCPNENCRRRVRILYGGKKFLCRNCHNLTYATSQTGNERTSSDNKLIRLRRKLNGSGLLLDRLPEKSPRMHLRRYLRLCNDYINLLQRRQQSCSIQIDVLVKDFGSVGELREATQEVSKTAFIALRQITDQYPTKLNRSVTYTLDDTPVTLSRLAKAARTPYEFAQEVQRERLLRPDTRRKLRRKLYRPKLASWLAKLQTLRTVGYTWEELRSWAKRRFLPGNESEIRWPLGFMDSDQSVGEM